MCNCDHSDGWCIHTLAAEKGVVCPDYPPRQKHIRQIKQLVVKYGDLMLAFGEHTGTSGEYSALDYEAEQTFNQLNALIDGLN